MTMQERARMTTLLWVELLAGFLPALALVARLLVERARAKVASTSIPSAKR
jgi:hypothetical protein